MEIKNKTVINLELNEHDANRLLWLVQRESVAGQTYNQYWLDLAANIGRQIEQDSLEVVRITNTPWVDVLVRAYPV